MAAMKRQPLIIYKTRGEQTVLTKHFMSTNEARLWLRSEGCKFSNGDLNKLEENALELFTADFEYSIEVDPLGPKRKVRRNG